MGCAASSPPQICSESCSERIAMSSSPSSAHSFAASNRCSASESWYLLGVRARARLRVRVPVRVRG